jgi:DNA adenine methylase
MEAEPFVKWAGGKRLMLPSLLPHIPQPAQGGTYFEPFVGGGAVFFGMQPESAVLSDVATDLIETYQAVKDDVEGVIERLRRMRRDKQEYYRIRASRPRHPSQKAARFIYLNKTCFNGLYRVNREGHFNVPFGDHGPNLLVCNRAQLRAAARALENATMRCCDFETVLQDARAGDVVYCDPPYTTAHSNNGFIEYNAHVFSWDDQRRLARLGKELVSAGVIVVVSNAYHSSLHDLYVRRFGFKSTLISRWSTMAGNRSFRFPTKEMVLVGGGS